MGDSLTVPMSALYERAWNKVVREYPSFRRRCVIEEPFGRHANEAAKEAIQLAEMWEDMGHNKEAPYHPDEEAN